MKKVLISFIGNNDCHLSDGQEGAIVSILKERTYDDLFLLYNDIYYLPYASEILVYARKHYPKLKVHYQEATSVNPIDYNLVYPAMVSAVNEIQKEIGNKDVEYTISLTSGTPTMHSCWILIVMSGLIKAKMIQISKQSGLQEVDFSLDDFPQITNDKQTKIELTKRDRENKALRQQLLNDYSEMIGEDSSVKKVKQLIASFAKYDIPVFIHGESGTGKEIVSRLLHYNSARKEKSFITVNCGSIPENLAESLFFGHKKGSFTGAISDQEGYFSQANQGTLFLDEIGDLPMSMQVKLLRVLEYGFIHPVGGKEKKVDVRIVSASNKSLMQLTNDGLFREDLYHRIVQGQISLSPLRERGTDILLLARHFLRKISNKNNATKLFSESAETKLLSYHYPGNVRQLQSIVELAYIHCEANLIEAHHINFGETPGSSNKIIIPVEGIDLDNEVVPAYYDAALRMVKGNAAEAARLLKLKPHTFRARLKKIEESKYNDLKR
ncbi:MAG: RNA repair transcriptional activator RtcR family protein [Candidatus Cloacimonas sp.]|nr:RNA repair transcriptional activator RtcR family protein [Candidatus Cloacimonadota bacterium]